MDQPAIRTEALTRTFRSRQKTGPKTPFVALGGITLDVAAGELLGILGPNGAGKTTLLKILTTLLAPTSGSALVDGLDVQTQADLIRPRINMVSGGESSGYGMLNIRENLWLFSQLYGVSTAVAHERIDRLLEVVGLADRATSRISHLSTGLRQKMNFCRGFITDPKILFLDEPTLGMDVTIARTIRTFIKDWMKEKPGRTMLLTTHYMMEADDLCDRVAIIDKGKIVACDTPTSLKRLIQRHRQFEISVTPPGPDIEMLSRLPGVHRVTPTATPESLTLKFALEEEHVIGNVVQTLVQNGGHILNLRNQEPTLEDVFIHLVGHGLSTDDQAPG